MKVYKLITIITVIFAIVSITVAAIFGIYKKDEFKMVNVSPKYKLGMELTESVTLNLTVDDSLGEQKLYDADGNEVNLEGRRNIRHRGYRDITRNGLYIC